MFSKAVPIIGGVLSILALSQALSYYIVDTQVPEMLTNWVKSVVQSKFLFLFLLNIALIVVGCLMDIFSAILVVLPLIAPLGKAYGIDPVHLGIIFVLNMEVGFLTPPIGLNLFLAAYRFKKPFIEICRSVIPFLLIQLAVVFLVTYIPWFTGVLLPFSNSRISAAPPTRQGWGCRRRDASSLVLGSSLRIRSLASLLARPASTASGGAAGGLVLDRGKDAPLQFRHAI